jgi:signal transduction histidine kinase
MADTPLRVLLLEDDPDDAFLLRDVLEESASGQFTLEHVTRLADAIERIGAERFDVVLSDLSVPDSQGLDTFLGIRNVARDMPIVVLTGLDDEAVAVRAVKEGAQDYLTKGRLDGPLLVRSLRYAIERQRVSHYQAVLLERERFDTAISHMSDGIVVTDGDWRITTANRAACLLLNLPPDGCEGRMLDEALAHFELSTPLRELKASTERTQALGISRPDTEPPLFLDGRFTQLFDASGRLTSAVLGLRDVTEERHQQELRATFFMMVSHKLRTPLTVLIACLDLCKRLPPDKAAGQLAEVLEVCDSEVQRLGGIVQQLLEFKAATTRDLEAGAEAADVVSVLVVTSEAVQRRHGGKKVEIISTVAPSIRQAACGAQHLRLVLDKLLDNAVKFCDKESVRVSVSVEEAESGWIRFSVTDNGPGIHEYFDRIFEPFVQVENLPTGQVPGIGVGLAMARQVVEALGGEISVESRLGEGSTFVFTIPAQQPGVDALSGGLG